MIEITISSDAPHFSQECLIFDRHYIIELQWIEREGFWVMHLYDGAENPIALGLRITPHWTICRQKARHCFYLIGEKSKR